MSHNKPLQIDLKEILRQRIPQATRRWIPGVLYTALEKIICQRELNGILQRTFPLRGSAFCNAVLADLEITVSVTGLDSLPPGRYIFASNHPLGGLDGITLIAALGARYGDENIRFLVNDMLMHVEPLSDVFLPINKYGSQGRHAATAIANAYASDGQIVIFPAGLVSRLHDDGSIHDLKWNKAFVAKAMEYDRPIVPVFFDALNRHRFYRWARLRKRLGIKVNLEQVTLPSELVHSRGRHFRIIFGSPIAPSRLKDSGRTPPVLAEAIRSMVYKLPQTTGTCHNTSPTDKRET